MKLDIGGGGVQADHVEDALDHVRLRQGDRTIGVAGKASAEVVLKVAVIGKIEFGLEGSDFGGDEGRIWAEEASVVDVEDKSNIAFGVEARVYARGKPAAFDEAGVKVVTPSLAGVLEAV